MVLNADALIGVLDELQREFPDKTITRDFFREHTEIPDRVWVGYFGTFPEFKKQSGLDETRAVAKVMNDRPHSIGGDVEGRKRDG